MRDMAFYYIFIDTMSASQRYKALILKLCLLFSIGMYGQLSQGPPAQSLGEQGVTFEGVTASSINPSGIAGQSGWQAIVFAERPFLLEELQSLYASASYSWNNADAVSLSIQRQGFEIYHETLLGLGYARKLTSGLSIGIRFDYLQTMIEQYGTDGAFTMDVGLQWQVFDQLKAGFASFNPFQVRYSNEAKIPSTFDFGLQYELSERVALYGGLHKTLHLPEDYRFGLHYELHDQLSFYLGVKTREQSISGGVDIALARGIILHVSAAVHNTLGISPGMALIYRQNQ